MALLFIITWWSWAFFSQSVETREPPPLVKIPSQDIKMSQLDREDLRQALCGDWALARRLMLDWDLDAQLAAEAGSSGTARLSRTKCLRTESAFRQLAAPEQATGRTGLLPQSYFSASVLLTLCEPEALVGLPESYRQWRAAVPDPKKLSQVPRDLSLQSLEVIAQLQPELAFVAPYSDVTVVEALKGLSVEVDCLPYICSVDDCCEQIRHLARAAQRPEQGELLSNFVEAALLHLKNRVRWATERNKSSRVPRLLYIHHYVDYSIPGKHTLVSELLRRFELADLQDELTRTDAAFTWTRPLQLEEIACLEPELIVVNCPDPDGTHRGLIYNEAALQSCPAVQRGAIIELDGQLQQSPSQFLVLAAYELVHAVEQGMEFKP